jgi:hypothetical protein
MKEDIETQQTAVTSVESSDAKFIDYQDADAALGFLRENSTPGQTIEIDEKKLMRKVDWMVMPLMFACYYLQYTDKTLCMLTIVLTMEAVRMLILRDQCRMPPSWVSLKIPTCPRTAFPTWRSPSTLRFWSANHYSLSSSRNSPRQNTWGAMVRPLFQCDALFLTTASHSLGDRGDDELRVPQLCLHRRFASVARCARVLCRT